jgi:hypothetical protein
MVRLVFRPYTQIRPLICTSKPLRASIRVSSDFALFRHSSPSFGSQHIRSYSVLKNGHLIKQDSLSFRPKLFHSLELAYMLDSLVRVSRRVGRFGYLNSLERRRALRSAHPVKLCANKDCLLRTIPCQHHPLETHPPPSLHHF